MELFSFLNREIEQQQLKKSRYIDRVWFITKLAFFQSADWFEPFKDSLEEFSPFDSSIFIQVHFLDKFYGLIFVDGV